MNTDFEYINGHDVKIFQRDLFHAYSLTNVGSFQVRAIGWFPAYEPLTNQNYVVMTPPPITLSITKHGVINKCIC